MREIPINTRAVGEPTGSYLLYLEDYVHTFIRRALQEERAYGELPLALYGYEFDENGRHYLIAAGAVDQSASPVSGERFFQSYAQIGEAIVREDGSTQLAFTIVLQNGKRLSLDDFYIYYDQNEEMQNYLIEWNLSRGRHRLRSEDEPAMQLTRIAQSYNREEARVNYLWNAVNLLSLGLMVCIMAFGIISVNNYHKMKNMEAQLTALLENTTDALATIAEIPVTEESARVYETEFAEIELSEPEPETQTTVEQLDVPASAPQPETPQTAEPATESQVPASVPVTYYIVQQGDTLRSISLSVYGDYTHVSSICTWNQIANPDNIFCGQTLLLQPE